MSDNKFRKLMIILVLEGDCPYPLGSPFKFFWVSESFLSRISNFLSYNDAPLKTYLTKNLHELFCL